MTGTAQDSEIKVSKIINDGKNVLLPASHYNSSDAQQVIHLLYEANSKN